MRKNSTLKIEQIPAPNQVSGGKMARADSKEAAIITAFQSSALRKSLLSQKKQARRQKMFVNDSREIVDLPVVSEENPSWKIEDLMHLLYLSIKNSGERCLHDNYGVIYTPLSGGVSSSFCLAMLRDIFGFETPIHTFTIAKNFTDPDYCSAAKMAKIFNTKHFCFTPSEKLISHARTYMTENSTVFNGKISDTDVANFLLYQFMNEFKDGWRSVVSHVGIDELFGGTWTVIISNKKETKRKMLEVFWDNFSSDCLTPLRQSSTYFKFNLLLPFLQKNLIKFVSRIPVDDRVKRGGENNPLREIAGHYLPEEILEREKKIISNTIKI